MTYEVDFNGRVRTVSIDRGGARDQYTITVDGCLHDVEARRAGPYGLVVAARTCSTKVPATSLGNAPAIREVREVFVTPSGAAGEMLVSLEGRTAVVTVNGRRTRHRGEAAVQPGGEASVVAPMPGRVVRVLVAPGDDVTAGQGVVVVEAMKMENELRAPRAGRVKAVGAVPGTSVEAGRVLVAIE